MNRPSRDNVWRASAEVVSTISVVFANVARWMRRLGAEEIEMSVERELIFGIAALQNALVSFEDLVATIHEWTSDKTQSLGDLLVRRGAMRADQRELIDRLTAERRGTYEGDLLRQLITDSSLEKLSEAFARMGDVELSARLQSAATVFPQSRAPTDTTSSNPDSKSRSTRSRFRILRPHARGGLGEVFVAQDDELHREVALKEIQTKFADDPRSRGRFLLEAEVTGGLEHPGIVPVYGLGHYDDGRPFYAMRFIKGDSLGDAITAFYRRQAPAALRPTVDFVESAKPTGTSLPDGRSKAAETITELATLPRPVAGAPSRLPSSSFHSVEFRKLLGRFVDVCQAISYAHSRGVLHRDLKPGNIMLGTYGETLVVDWGLAKVRGQTADQSDVDARTLRPMLGSGPAATLLGSAVGTPAYMPPEQAGGRLDEVGPTSDVYSLGATLHHILTGRAPFYGGNVAEILRQVQAGGFEPPRFHQPHLPPALDAISRKAMALNRADRYSTPQQLAEDIERYLADEPVTALPEPLIAKGLRWVRKHQGLAAATAAVILVSAAGLGLLLFIVGAKNRELNAAFLREKSANAQAQANERSARQQSQLALSTLSSVINDIQGSLENLAGGGEVRRRLLETSLEKLGEISTTYIAQSTIDHSTCSALVGLGDIVMQFEPANPFKAGDEVSTSAVEPSQAMTLAAAFYQRAREIAEQLVAQNPGDAKALKNFSIANERLGDWNLRAGQVVAARNDFERELKIAEALVAADPCDENRRDLEIALGKIGDVQLRLGHFQAALDAFRQEFEIALSLAESNPQNTIAQSDLSISHERMATVSEKLGQTDESKSHLNRKLKIDTLLVSGDPTNVRHRFNLSIAYSKLGDLDYRSEQIESAIENYGEANKILEGLAAADPSDTLTQRNLQTSLAGLGNASLRAGRVEAAQSYFQRDIEIARKLAEHDPQNTEAQRNLALSHGNLGNLYLQTSKHRLALDAFRQSYDINASLAADNPSDAEALRHLEMACNDLGDAYLAAEEWDKALEVFHRANETCAKTALANPNDMTAQRGLAITFQRLGDVSLQLNKASDALNYYRQMNSIFEKQSAANPSDSLVRRDLSVSYWKLGDACMDSEQFAEALDWYRRRHEIATELADDDPTNMVTKHDLMFSSVRIGLAQSNLGNFEESVAALSSAADVLKGMIEQGMNVDRSRDELKEIENVRDEMQLKREATGNWTALLERPPAQLAKLLELRAITLAQLQRFEEAAQAAGKLQELEAASAPQLYVAASVFGLCAASIRSSEGAELTEAQSKLRQTWIDNALAALKRSIDAGWNDFGHMRQNPDLDILRDLSEFQELMKQP